MGGPIKPSFLIEVMAHDLVDTPFTTYPREVQRFFAAVPAVLSGPWPDPTGLGPPVSDQITPDLVTKAISALRQAEKKASLANAPRGRGQARRGARPVHGPLLSSKLMPITQAVIARKHGDDFQARLFWLHAALLLDTNGHVIRVGYETGPKAFDDVLVEYDPGRAPQDHHGLSVLRDHFQCKWHVKLGEFSYADLTDPAFSNATSLSFLKRARDAQLQYAPEGTGARFKLVTNWRLIAGDPLAKLIRTQWHALDLAALFDGTTDASAMGKLRKAWSDHLDRSQGQDRCVSHGQMKNTCET